MNPEPSLQDIINKIIAALNDAVNRKIKLKEARNTQALRVSDGCNTVAGYGTLSESNPSDSTVDGQSDEADVAFLNACQTRAEELDSA